MEEEKGPGPGVQWQINKRIIGLVSTNKNKKGNGKRE